MPLLQQYLVVGAGGALGSMLRLGVGSWVDSAATKASPIFPWGTILVNVTGCFAIGLLVALSAENGRIVLSPLSRAFLLIGILGGYTTFSSFSLQTLMLAQAQQWWGASLNVMISVVACLAGVALGTAVGTWANELR